MANGLVTGLVFEVGVVVILTAGIGIIACVGIKSLSALCAAVLCVQLLGELIECLLQRLAVGLDCLRLARAPD